MKYAQAVAEALLSIKAVGFVVHKPITFKSGLVSPVYIDNRRFPFYPEAWNVVLEGFKQLITDARVEFDVIAGIETAGIPHSAALGYVLQQPSVFVRKTVKDHGTKKMVEGGSVAGKRVLLLEDHVTTGGSSLTGVQALREAGATVTDCLAITSYEFASAQENFAKERVQLHTLTSFNQILSTALQTRAIAQREKQAVEVWLQDPQQWATNWKG